ncbi:glycosyltransferase [Saccharospirillum alexandrii]|uniref:glycosyltransferase n=1 Tax=Saccharospirillum alexandrii TaxID=2448477 RepID=UPI000FDC346D|nr:glycosyltransferase [Saccharospirillum alexandrii]
MVFLTVGTQFSFDRLVAPVYDWCKRNNSEYIFQVGASLYLKDVEDYRIVKNMSSESYYNAFSKARVVISHAGMGTILSAIEYEKPLLIMPREFRYKEHRNDHQVDTIRHLSALLEGCVVRDPNQLIEKLELGNLSVPTKRKENFKNEKLLIQNLTRVITGDS